MKIIKINNNYSSEVEPSISDEENGTEFWFLNNKLHRGGGKPAVKSGLTRRWYHRGVMVTENIANARLSTDEILKIPNMETRQAAMEIVGYENFFSNAKLIDKFTPENFEILYPPQKNPMYSLYRLHTSADDGDEPILILSMIDPSKTPIVKYFIRVAPTEKTCSESVAHSYGYKTWDEYIADTICWV